MVDEDQGLEEGPVVPNPETTASVSELEKLQRESAEYKDKYLRQLAEMENARKRLTREKEENTQFAVSCVVNEFLHPMDNMENALKFAEKMSDEVKHWAVGFQMILAQFKDVLSNNGVHSFESVGKHFDPHYHEAVESIETDSVAPGTVLEEFVKGYKMGKRVIRPARVKVSKATHPKTHETSNEIASNGVEPLDADEEVNK